MPLPHDYHIRTGSEHMQPERVHHWLSTESYWAQGIPLHTVQAMIRNSCCVGIFHEEKQVAFARFITDYATFAYLADVYVEEAHRGKGLSHAMLQTLMGQPFVAGLRKLFLGTRDAQTLYEKYGFGVTAHPDRIMEITRHDCYILNQA